MTRAKGDPQRIEESFCCCNVFVFEPIAQKYMPMSNKHFLFWQTWFRTVYNPGAFVRCVSVQLTIYPQMMMHCLNVFLLTTWHYSKFDVTFVVDNCSRFRDMLKRNGTISDSMSYPYLKIRF